MLATWKSSLPLVGMVACLTAFYLVDRHQRAAETERLRAEVRALADGARREAGSAHAGVARQPIFVTQVVTAAPSDHPEAPPPPARSSGEDAPRAPRPDDVAARFADEPRARGGAAREERVIRSAVSSFLAATSEVDSIECRASLCRLEFVHPDVPTSNALLEKLFFGPTAALPGASFVSPKPEAMADGHLRVVVLVPREEIARLDG